MKALGFSLACLARYCSPPASESAFRIMSRMISTGLGLGIAVRSGCLAIFMLPGWISRTT
jgi:hypothetical protein